MNNAEWMIQNGYKLKDILFYKNYTDDESWDYRIEISKANLNEHVKGADRADALLRWLAAEHIEPILDDAEREYLSAVIRPFRKRVWYIRKAVADDTSVYKCSYYIFIRFNEGTDDMKFPVFHKSNMYKGMSTARTYTPEELGL